MFEMWEIPKFHPKRTTLVSASKRAKPGEKSLHGVDGRGQGQGHGGHQEWLAPVKGDLGGAHQDTGRFSQFLCHASLLSLAKAKARPGDQPLVASRPSQDDGARQQWLALHKAARGEAHLEDGCCSQCRSSHGALSQG